MPCHFFATYRMEINLECSGTNLSSRGSGISLGPRFPWVTLFSFRTLNSRKSLRAWCAFLSFFTFYSVNLPLFTFYSRWAWITRFSLSTLKIKHIELGITCNSGDTTAAKSIYFVFPKLKVLQCWRTT